MRLAPDRACLALLAVALAGCQPSSPAPEAVAPAPAAQDTAAPAPVPDATAPAPAPAVDTITLETLVAPDDTLATLRARHGEANVTEAEVPMGEGTTEPGWILFADVPEKQAYVYLDETGRPTYVRVEGKASEWTSGTGVSLGMDVRALAALNGKPFDFSGFGWDYGGNVMDFHGGALANDRFTLTVCVPDTDGEWPLDYPQGEAPVSSDDTRLEALIPYACVMGTRLSAPPAEPVSDEG